jgi:hypothetical protein
MTWFWLGGNVQGAAAENSAELLKQLRIVTQRDGLVNDRDLTDAKAFLFLTQAQRMVTYDLVTHLPELMKGAPEKMTTSDGGLTYSTSKDPLGHIEVYENLRSEIPMTEGPLWSPIADFTREGTRKIRMQGNIARTFSDGPYARYVKKPGVIDAVSQPTLEPADLRMILPWKAAMLWAMSGNGYDPAPYARMVEIMLWGDPDSPGSVGAIQSYRSQYSSSGSDGSSLGLWWRSPDLGRSG